MAGIALVTPPTILGPEPLGILSMPTTWLWGRIMEVGAGGTALKLSSTGVLLPEVIVGTVTASSPLPGLEDSPAVLESNGDSWRVACLHRQLRTAAIRKGSFSAKPVRWIFSFHSKEFHLGTESTNTPGPGLQSNRHVVVVGFISNAAPKFGGIARRDTNGKLDERFGAVER